MKLQIEEKTIDAIYSFHLPGYQEIPDVGLYLNQVAKYINGYMQPFTDMEITESMISNYVKKHLVANPVKKQYYREQVAYLLVIAVLKSVLSLDDIRQLIDLQKQTYSSEHAYDYFCMEFENVLLYVFGIKDSMEMIGEGQSDAKLLFRSVIITVAHKIYLDQCFAALQSEKQKIGKE